MPTTEGHKFKATYISCFGCYEYIVMPFGFYNAPATFQQLTYTIFKDSLDVFIIFYLNSILIFIKSEAGHFEYM